MYGNTCNEAKKFIFLATSHTNQPILNTSRRLQGPLKECYTVVKPEIGIVILNVVVSQQLVKLIAMFIITQIDICPIVTSRQR